MTSIKQLRQVPLNVLCCVSTSDAVVPAMTSATPRLRARRTLGAFRQLDGTLVLTSERADEAHVTDADWSHCVAKAAFTPGHMLPGNKCPGRATCIRIHICWRSHVAGYKLLVRDTCWLYLGDIITIHLCHGRLVSLFCIQQTGDKLATILLPIYKKHVDGNKWIQLVSGNMCPGVNAA